MEIRCIKLNHMTESVLENQQKVSYMLPGETATVGDAKSTIIHEKDITVPSKDRTKVICPIFYACGGCDFLHISYQAQLDMKKEHVKKQLMDQEMKVFVHPVIANPTPIHYRHKIVASATMKDHKIRLGLFREGTKEVIPYTHCHIQDQEANQVIKTIESLFQAFKLTAYDIDRNQGIIKHVLIRKSYAHQTMLVAIVTQGYVLPNHKILIRKLIEKHPKIVTVVQNIHDKKTKLVLLNKEKILYGKGWIEDEIEGLRFRLSAQSFYQVNPIQMFALYKKAIEIADIGQKDVVLDAYSGIGTLSLLIGKKAKKVYAIEINGSAHRDAVINKKINDMDHVDMIRGDVEQMMMSLDMPIDILFMDPTRDGATPKFLEALKILKPKKVIYISCEPETQARDLKALMPMYAIKDVFPVDMFSQTKHVESITLLSLKTA